jgi:hypothetical protein
MEKKCGKKSEMEKKWRWTINLKWRTNEGMRKSRRNEETRERAQTRRQTVFMTL